MVSNRDRCIAPGTVSADELLAHARREASPAVAQHLQACPVCRTRAEGYASAERTLTAAFFRRSCPPPVTIGEFALGSLAATEAITLAEHLLECPHCAEERRAFSSFLTAPDEPSPQEGAVARLLRRLFAQPVAVPAALAALRGDFDDSTVTYEVDGYQLTVGAQRPDGGHMRVIVGLLLEGFASSTAISARLFLGDQLLQTSAVDDLGNFFFDGVTAGEYRLELGLSDAVLVIGPLHIS